jgi:two-component system chemotaxis response regulator CheY
MFPTKVINLLIVDDSSLTREAIEDVFSDNFFAIHQASDGFEALEKVRAIRPDIITMDLTMQPMGGIEAITEIKKIHKEAKILVVSALGDKSDIMESIKRGAVGFLKKPITNTALKDAMEQILEGMKVDL